MAAPPIRLGLQIPSFTYPGGTPEGLFDTVIEIARTAEATQFDSVYVMDHFYQLPMLGSPDQPMLEAYTALAGLAVATERVLLGTMVGGVTYRNPAFLAKTVSTLDVIAKGRAIWAIGAAWFEQEHDAYGYEFGTFTERFEKLEEALQIVKSMFVNQTTTFEGKWFTVREALNNPKPVRPGGPPVLVGGSGERKTLRMVAQYADACNVSGDPAHVAHLMGVLDEHCATFGRDPREITRTRIGSLVLDDTRAAAERRFAKILEGRGMDLASMPQELADRVRSMLLVGDADDVGEVVQSYRDAGIEGFIFNIPDAHLLEPVTVAGELLGPVLQG